MSVYAFDEPCDMRKSFDTLAALVIERLTVRARRLATVWRGATPRSENDEQSSRRRCWRREFEP